VVVTVSSRLPLMFSVEFVQDETDRKKLRCHGYGDLSNSTGHVAGPHPKVMSFEVPHARRRDPELTSRKQPPPPPRTPDGSALGTVAFCLWDVSITWQESSTASPWQRDTEMRPDMRTISPKYTCTKIMFLNVCMKLPALYGLNVAI